MTWPFFPPRRWVTQVLASFPLSSASGMSSARPPPHPGVDALDELEGDDHPMGDASSVVATVGVSLIQAIVFVYDFVTYPIYYCAQQPWKQVRQDFLIIVVSQYCLRKKIVLTEVGVGTSRFFFLFEPDRAENFLVWCACDQSVREKVRVRV